MPRPAGFSSSPDRLSADSQRAGLQKLKYDEGFLKLVRQLAAMNTSVPNLAAAIEEDIGYGAHRVDRDYKHERAI